jgi:hypothetical protein
VPDMPAATSNVAAPCTTSEQNIDASRSGVPKHTRCRRARTLLLTPLILALVATAGLSTAPIETAARSRSCTGWTSLRVPPATIRVLTRSGAVRTVDFRRYVAVVMGKEWGGYLPQATLNAAAIAVKQYAWYHALRGNHRRGFVTRSGACYDVTHTTRDQLYRPHKAHVTRKHWKAINRTWDVSLRKGGKFFMTGYRTGNRVRCGRDANGWLLKARSAIDCARRGLSGKQIIAKYYGPRLSLVSSDGAIASVGVPDVGAAAPGGAADAPSAPSAPEVNLVEGAVLGQGAALISWESDDQPADIARYKLQQRIDGGEWTKFTRTNPDAPSTTALLTPNVTLQYRVRAIAADGRRSRWTKGPSITPLLLDQRSRAIDWRGNWHRYSDETAWATGTTYAAIAGSSATFRLTGRGLAVVGAHGPTSGAMLVFVDGELVDEVDLYAEEREPRVLLWTTDWAETAEHTIRIEVDGTSERSGLDLDAILVLN